MRYIRTEDGRIAEIKGNMFVKQCNDALRLVYKDRPCICVLNGNDNIIKQAKTIEELCDEFVVVDGERHFNVYYAVDLVDEYLRKTYLIRGDYEVYGAIWTDKGLIYMAKMNKKGELELI